MEKKEYIDREAVLTVIKAVFEESDPVGEEQFGLLKAHRIVREAPAADVAEVVHGEWIGSHVPDSILDECSICHFDCGAYSFKYCPNCGAKMDGERKEE